MAPVRCPYCRNPRRMPGNRQPIMNRRPDPSSQQRRFTLPLVAGNQQEHALTGSNRAFECTVDGFPRAVQSVPVQVERPVWIDPASPQLAVPTPVQRRLLDRCSRF
jgi:hypothetical protein